MARQQGRTTESDTVEGFLRWTEAMRQRTHGRRGSWHAPLEMDEKGVIERLAEPENRKWLEKFRFDEACAPFRQRIIDTPSDRLYSLEDDPCLEGVRAAVYRLSFKYTIVPWWCREKGAAFALQALIWQHRVYYTNFWVRLEYDREYLELESWKALRNGVAAASPEAYEEAVQVAERLRRELAGTKEQHYRFGIAYAFPGRADWGLEDATSQVAQRSLDRHAICLLGSVTDVDVLGQLARKILKLPADDYTAKTWDEYVPDMLANVGLPALPVLLAMFDGAKKAGHKQTVVNCLSVIETDEVAKFFVQHLADKHAAKVGAAWLTRNPELFVRALSRMEKPPDTATGLLAQLRQKDPVRIQAAESAVAGPAVDVAAGTASGATAGTGAGGASGATAGAGAGTALGATVGTGAGTASGATVGTGAGTASGATVGTGASGAGGAAASAGSVTPAAAEASAEQLPALLVRPPWVDKLKRKPITVPSLSLLECAEHVAWEPGEEETIRQPRGFRNDPVDLGEATAKRDEFLKGELGAWRRDERPRGSSVALVCQWSRFCAVVMAMTDAGARDMLAPQVESTDNRVHHGLFLPLFTRLGMEPLPLLITLVMKGDTYLSDALLPQLVRVVSPRVGQAMGQLASGRKNQRPVARAWLQQHPEIAAIGIIPCAVGGTGSERTKAESALRWMARSGQRAVLESVAARYGPKVEEALREILDSDLGFDKLPKMPAFWSPEAWPRPALRSGGVLPRSAMDHLGTMLAVSTLDEPHYGLDTVRDACTPESLAAFAESLCDAWLVAGMPAQQAWAFHALAHLGDEGTVRKLVAHLNKWPAEGAGGRTRTMTGIEILAGQGSDLALLHVQRISQTARIRAIQEKAATTLEEAARARGLSLAELEDRLVPHLGLDTRGSLRLDFGPRSFTVRFDEQLAPFVVDESGARLAQFPRANRDDDDEKARAASDLYKQLRDDVASVAATQVRRLEQAMCQMRRWRVPDFERYLLRHPLMCHLVRRLVWATFGSDGRLELLFRMAEDGTLASVDDGVLALPEQATVGIPHRLELTDEQAAAWGSVLADYAIAQPFPQVGRDTYAPTPDELDKTCLAQPDVRTKGGRLRGLGHRGWRMFVDSTWVHIYEKVLADGTNLTLAFEPGWDVAAPSDGEQTAHAVRSSVPIADLSPVVYSEMVRDYLWLQT